MTFFVLPFWVFVFSAAQQQTSVAPPVLLAEALKLEPGIRLLVPATDLREYSQAEIEKFGYWPPWIVRDLDRDKRPDVAAVVVKPSPRGTEYGVIAIHARSPKELHWVIPLDTEVINGVGQGPASDTIVPLFCIECDANAWFRFAGAEYEAELYAIGEKIDVGTETTADVPLYASANLASKTIATIEHCAAVVVRKVGGTPEERWYYVETPDGEHGWIPDTFTAADICIG